MKKKYKVVMLKKVKEFVKKMSKEDKVRFQKAMKKIKKNPEIGTKIKNTSLRYFDF